jgi:hypothetical protein
MVTLMCRPEDVHISPSSANAAGRILELRFQGDKHLLVISLNSGDTILARSSSRSEWRKGQTVAVAASHVCIYDRTGSLLRCCEVSCHSNQ